MILGFLTRLEDPSHAVEVAPIDYVSVRSEDVSPIDVPSVVEVRDLPPIEETPASLTVDEPSPNEEGEATPTGGAPSIEDCEATPDGENGSSSASPEATSNEETGPSIATPEATPTEEGAAVGSGATAKSSSADENAANVTEPATNACESEATPGSSTATDGSEAEPASVALRMAFRPEHVRRPRGYVGPWSPYEIYEDQMLPRVQPGSLGLGSVRDYLLGMWRRKSDDEKAIYRRQAKALHRSFDDRSRSTM